MPPQRQVIVISSDDDEDQPPFEGDNTFNHDSTPLFQQNNLDFLNVSYHPLLQLLKRLTSTTNNTPPSPASSDLEIIYDKGKKRLRDSKSPPPLSAKRTKLEEGEEETEDAPLLVHTINLRLVLPPAKTTKELAEKKAFLQLCSKKSQDLSHLTSPVRLISKRGQIQISTPEEPTKAYSLTTLFVLKSLDKRNELAMSLAKSERRVRGEIIVSHEPKIGEGSLLDSVLYLKSQSHINSETTLSFSIDPHPTLILKTKVYIPKSFYKINFSSTSRRILLQELFPSRSKATEDSPEVSLDWFFSTLGRAPRTVDGIRIEDVPISAEVWNSVQRERRKSKGKGKARDQVSAAEGNAVLDFFEGGEEKEEEEEDWVEEVGEEDDLISPPGLKATLHPFQSRTLRWMLFREGKYIDPSNELTDLPETLLKEVLRGPLWEKVDLDLPPVITVDIDDDDDSGREKETKEFWLNRITGALKEDDPVEGFFGKDEMGMDIDDVEGEEEDEKKLMAIRDLGGQGGFLSEEMGLGKTIEVLSLILLHRQPERNLLKPYHNFTTDSEVQPSSLTLVISPSAIVAQWASEVKKHCPVLRVLRYESIKSVKEIWTPAYLSENYDVILTTFDVLRRDVVLARKPHERVTRSGPEGRPRYRRSLLVQIDFLRVIMDEVQLVGDLISASSETAALIPRKFSWAISGTPLKSKLEDFQSLLRFLKLEPIGSYRPSLNRLFEEVEVFKRVVTMLGARTVKAQVEHELVLPRQMRFLVPVEFSPVEKYWYEERYLEALDQLGLESDGSIKEENMDEHGNARWDLDESDLNRWLGVLRQLCCHPQVGEKNKRLLGNVLKTVDEVLLNLKDGAVAGVHAEQRQFWVHKVRRAQLQMWDKEDCERFEDALAIFQAALAELESMVVEIVEALRETWAERKAEKRRRGVSEGSHDDHIDQGVGAALGFGLEDEEKSTANDIPLSEKERQIATRLSQLRNRLREVLIAQHSAHFFAGSAYFNLGKFDEDEREAYAKAEELRQTLLTPLEVRVEAARVKLKEQLAERDRVDKLLIKDIEFPFSKQGGGLIAQQTFDDIDSTIDSLNGQAELVWTWREEILEMMLKGQISISGEDSTGDEYAERAEMQEKLDLMIEAYGALLDDWRYGLTGEHSALTDANLEAYGYDKQAGWTGIGGKRKREHKQAKKKKIDIQHRAPPSLARGDTAGEVLRYQLLLRRAEVQGERKLPEKLTAPSPPKRGKGKAKAVDSDDEDVEEPVDDDPNCLPIRTLIKRLRDALDDFDAREEEKLLITAEQRRLREVAAPLEKRLDRLRAEHGDITKAFNARLNYFAQLQVISDNGIPVADPDFASKKWKGLPQELKACADEAEALEKSILKKKGQRRYLEGLHSGMNAIVDEEDTVCVICSDVYTKGVLTTCGHLFCEECFKLWHSRQRNCAICKKELKTGDYESVRYRHPMPGKTAGGGELDYEDEDMEHVEYQAPVILRTLAADVLEEIRDVETVRPLSSKSDMIVKHVKFLRRNDPTAKIVVFSTWTEALDILMQAFTRNGIQFVRLENANGNRKEAVVTQFIQDPNIAAFLLHTRSQSAGLNLVVAQYVFLVEPLFHASQELQAVGRTHRIGQEKETTVFQYYISNTVDYRVAELRGRQKTSLFLANTSLNPAKEARILQADLLNSPRKTADDAVDDADDLSRCLFQPEHFRNLQRSLLPPHLRKGVKATPSAAEMAGLAAETRNSQQPPRRGGVMQTMRKSTGRKSGMGGAES